MLRIDEDTQHVIDWLNQQGYQAKREPILISIPNNDVKFEPYQPGYGDDEYPEPWKAIITIQGPVGQAVLVLDCEDRGGSAYVLAGQGTERIAYLLDHWAELEVLPQLSTRDNCRLAGATVLVPGSPAHLGDMMMDAVYAIQDPDGSSLRMSHDRIELEQVLQTGQTIIFFATESEPAEYAYEQGCPWADAPYDNEEDEMESLYWWHQ
jgi:hypothetical protein